ncbi:RES family NAD+ phosphorylase [Cutibacterium sp. V947]|uniref:RES family NAD+ phosphorylase n=1 Tax=Cutibacterium sp. V947 TaxID=3446480 RepID=UPI003EE217CD
MTEKYCCANCFGDPGLTQSIIPKVIGDGTGQPRDGDCGYCGTRNTITINPSALSQWFEMLVDCYAEKSEGRSLAALLAEDWSLFDNPSMDEAHAKELLAEILNDGEIVRRSFVPVRPRINEKPQQWDALRDEMMHRNRWFLDKPIDLERLAEMLELLVAPAGALKEITDVWHRARLLSDDKPFFLSEMGAPPAHLAGHGRANPAGIPYLYLGSTATTAVSEVRPHTGEKACIATFQVRPIRAIDLRDPRKSASPFILENAEQIMSLRSGLPLLERLGEELTKPVQPRSAAYEYIPSQYLCEFIKKRGYQGVIYRSSVSDGVNLALFSPEHASPVETKVILVDRVTVVIAGAA